MVAVLAGRAIVVTHEENSIARQIVNQGGSTFARTDAFKWSEKENDTGGISTLTMPFRHRIRLVILYEWPSAETAALLGKLKSLQKVVIYTEHPGELPELEGVEIYTKRTGTPPERVGSEGMWTTQPTCGKC